MSLTLLTPLFYAFLFLEYVHTVFIQRRKYPWAEFRISAVLLFLQYVVNGALLATFFSLTLKVWDHRLYTIPFPNFAVEFIFYFVLNDLLYFAYHWLSHRVRILWAGHFIHHVSTEYMLLSGLRTGFSRIKWPFIMIPFVYLGVEPVAFLAALALNRFLQWLMHTDLIAGFGPLELILNSPPQHRLHHSKHGPSLDKNFAGIFIIFDRLAGTYVRTGERELGISSFPKDLNPFQVLIYEWKRILADLTHVKGFTEKLKILFGPPS